MAFSPGRGFKKNGCGAGSNNCIRMGRDLTQTFAIDRIVIVDPLDVSVLKNEPGPALTLVTCYPFYFIGNAPQRYIVHASLVSETKPTNESVKASLKTAE